jgi:hypothetical protein
VTHTLVLTTYDERFVMDVEVFQVKAWLFLLKIKCLEYLRGIIWTAWVVWRILSL